MTARAAASDLWILNGLLVTQDPKRRVMPGHILVRNGRIEKITRSVPRVPKGTRTLDASGLALLPGFVQAHVHLCQTLFRNLADDLELMDWLQQRIWPFEAAHTAKSLEISAMLGIHELLTSGTTCILDMGTVRHTDAILEAVRSTGIRASVGKCLMDHPKTTPALLREPAKRALAEASSLHAEWNGRENDRIRVSYAPRFVVSCTEELLRAVATEARERGAVVHTHASENRRELELVRQMTGHDNVEYLHKLGLTSPRLVLAHCIWLSDSEAGRLIQTGSHAVHCPSSNLKLASGIARVPELLRLGLNIALGADGAPCNNNLDMFGEMRLAATLHKPGAGPRAVRAQEALDMATLNGARALDWASDIGSLEEGKRADLFALDLLRPENLAPQATGLRSGAAPTGKGDPDAVVSSIVYASRASHVHWTLVDGRLVAKDGRLTGVDPRRLAADAHTAQLALLRRKHKS